MAHYVVSDIHGEADRFYAMLDKIQFSDCDILYILGDVVDRGTDRIALLQQIIATPNIVMILGNHEYMMLDYLIADPDSVAIRRWNKNGNSPTLRPIAFPRDNFLTDIVGLIFIMQIQRIESGICCGSRLMM